MEKRFKFRHVNEVAGLFVLGMLGVVVVASIMMMRSHHWFAAKYTLTLLLPESGAGGLSRGNQVFILGLSAGAVDDIQVDDQGRLTALAWIQADFKPFVRTDSTATIRKTFGVAGDAYVEISRGTGPPLPQTRPAIPCQPSEELPGMMDKLIAEVRREVVPVLHQADAGLKAWTQLGADLQQTRHGLERLLARLDRLATGLEQGQGAAGHLLTDTALTDEARRVLVDSRNLLAKGQTTLAQLESALSHVQTAAARLPDVADAVAAEAKDLPGLVLQTQQTVHQLERLIEGLQRHWLLRKYIPPAHDTTSRLPPYRVPGGLP
ncbi:MAG: MCE family protein [Verrucomicrobia bacterium]|nr:MCE family protein [Verrucomicrobiota bacterium]